MSCISHVPQNIYITDRTILENIAFGVPIEKIDLNRVYDAASALLTEFNESRPGDFILLQESVVSSSVVVSVNELALLVRYINSHRFLFLMKRPAHLMNLQNKLLCKQLKTLVAI